MSAVVDTYRAAQRAGEFNAGPRQGVAQYTGSRPHKQALNGGFTVLNAASTRAAERASAILQTEYHHRTAPKLIWSRVVPLGVQQRVPLEHPPPLVERSGGGGRAKATRKGRTTRLPIEPKSVDSSSRSGKSNCLHHDELPTRAWFESKLILRTISSTRRVSFSLLLIVTCRAQSGRAAGPALVAAAAAHLLLDEYLDVRLLQ